MFVNPSGVEIEFPGQVNGLSIIAACEAFRGSVLGVLRGFCYLQSTIFIENVKISEFNGGLTGVAKPF
jgi:hypothetical protein